MQRLARALCAAVLAAGTSALGLPAASAADAGLLRLAHLSPDTPTVDVYVDSVSDPAARMTLPGVSYGAVSDYRRVPPGNYTVSMRPAGAAVSTPPVLSTTVEVAGASARTVAGVGHFAQLGLKVLDDNLSLPPEGKARMRIVAAAAGAGAVDVSVSGASVASALPLGRTGSYVDVPAGHPSLSVRPSGGAASDLPVDLAAGSVYSVLVLDRPGGGLSVRAVLDAGGPSVVPVGGVAAGAGGTAGSAPAGVLSGPLRAVAAVAAGAVVLAGTVLLATGRRPAGRRSPTA